MRRRIQFCTALAAACFMSAGLQAQTKTGNAELIKVSFPQAATFNNLSDNGLWATAKGTHDSDQSKDAYPYLVNTTDGSIMQLWTEEQKMDAIGAYDVTDNGKLVVGTFNSEAATYDVDNATWTTLPIADETMSFGLATCVTPDGTFIAGWGSKNDFGSDDYEEIPLMWEKQQDGSYKEIDVYKEFANFPNVTKTGEDSKMVRISVMSADGNIVGGAVNFIYPGETGFYIYDRSKESHLFIDSKMVAEEGSYVDNSLISSNGRWMTGAAYAIVPSGNFFDEYYAAYKYDIANDVFELYNAQSDERDRMGFSVSNSGICFASSPATMPTRSAYYRMGTIWFGIDELLYGRYGINFYEDTGYSFSGIVIGISDNEQTFIGMASAKGDGYIVNLPETFAEAASQINPLKTVSIYPQSGATFAKMTRATIAFTKQTVLKEGVKAKLKDNGNNVIAEYDIINAGDGKTYLINGESPQLGDGETYTFSIEAGAFSLYSDDTYKSEEITATYIGRDNVPVEMLSSAPANNANVSEISSINPVQINFDINIALSGFATATLFEEGSDVALTNMEVAASGSSVVIYPNVKRYLKKGVKYEVVLEANSVADIMGYCANEEIRLTFNGAYEQPFTPTGDLFADDFNDMGTSMVTYLLYEGDNNEPSDLMKQLEFTSSSTPWNFSIRESEASKDYCAASTSMYTPAGKSDDWMSLPQLMIGNEDYALTFDAQSYKNGKNDVLKVYILEEDATYDVFTSELYNKFKSNGKCVFEKTLSPGSSEEGLAGDWQTETISLEEYSGKSVYIAFVNENEDQSMIFIDNVRVYYKGDFLFNDNTPKNVVKAEEVTVSGAIKITGNNTYNDLTVTYTSNDGKYTDTFTANGLDLSADDEAFEFTFEQKLPVEIGTETGYTIDITFDNKTLRTAGSVKNLMFEPVKRVVLEEATGQWCGNCPLGIVAIEDLHNQYGDKVIPIGVHGGGVDMFSYNEYVAYHGFTAFPSGLVNRIDTVYAPAYNGSFTSAEGNKTFHDIVARELNTVTYADIAIDYAYFDKKNENVEIAMNVNYALDMNSLNQNLAFIVIENGLVGNQTNYYYNTENELFGDFGKGGKYGTSNPEIVYNEVARKILDRSFAGTGGIIPSEVKAGEPVNHTMTATLPDNVENWNNAEIVCMLLDANTGLVINATKAKFTDKNSVENIAGGNVTIAAGEGEIFVSCPAEANVTIYNANGMEVANENILSAGEMTAISTEGKAGLFIVKVTDENGSKIQKVIVR